jgi:hypothetical protein
MIIFRFLLFSSWSLSCYYLFGSIVSGLHISPPKSRVSINKGITKHVKLRNIQINKTSYLSHFVCVGEIISLPWFSKELKTTYRITTGFVASSLYFSFVNQYSLGGGFSFLIVLVPRYKLSLCHTPIKLDLLGFSAIDVFECGLHDHVITRFVSFGIRAWLR